MFCAQSHGSQNTRGCGLCLQDTPEGIYSSLPLQKKAIKKSLSTAERNSPHGDHRKRSGKMRPFCKLGHLQRRRCSICSFYEGGFGQVFGYCGHQSLSVSMTMLIYGSQTREAISLMLLPAFWHKDAKDAQRVSLTCMLKMRWGVSTGSRHMQNIMSWSAVLLVWIETVSHVTHRKLVCSVLVNSKHMIQTNWASWLQNQWSMWEIAFGKDKQGRKEFIEDWGWEQQSVAILPRLSLVIWTTPKAVIT